MPMIQQSREFSFLLLASHDLSLDSAALIIIS
jgi:hypothetical protein